MYRRMDVLVEGRDDREFFNAVIRPVLEKQYDYVQVKEYARDTIETRIKYIRSICAMKADYLFLTDINASPCITGKKQRTIDRHKGRIDADRMIVVRREIESWYLAGLDDAACRELGIQCVSHTDDVTKERFRAMVPARFEGSVVDFMTEVVNRFRMDVARRKNRSFGYLMDQLEKKTGEA